MAQREYNKPEELTRRQIRKLKPGESYIHKGKLGWRRTSKQIRDDFFITLLGWILFPFMWIYKKVGGFLYNFFHPRTNERWNGIIGPGGHTSYERHFNWGKLSFILVVLFIITYLIFLR